MMPSSLTANNDLPSSPRRHPLTAGIAVASAAMCGYPSRSSPTVWGFKHYIIRLLDTAGLAHRYDVLPAVKRLRSRIQQPLETKMAVGVAVPVAAAARQRLCWLAVTPRADHTSVPVQSTYAYATASTEATACTEAVSDHGEAPPTGAEAEVTAAASCAHAQNAAVVAGTRAADTLAATIASTLSLDRHIVHSSEKTPRAIAHVHWRRLRWCPMSTLLLALVAALGSLGVVTAATETTDDAWRLRSSLPNVTAIYSASRREFRAFLLADGVLNCVTLFAADCHAFADAGDAEDGPHLRPVAVPLTGGPPGAVASASAAAAAAAGKALGATAITDGSSAAPPPVTRLCWNTHGAAPPASFEVALRCSAAGPRERIAVTPPAAAATAAEVSLPSPTNASDAPTRLPTPAAVASIVARRRRRDATQPATEAGAAATAAVTAPAHDDGSTKSIAVDTAGAADAFAAATITVATTQTATSPQSTLFATATTQSATGSAATTIAAAPDSATPPGGSFAASSTATTTSADGQGTESRTEVATEQAANHVTARTHTTSTNTSSADAAPGGAGDKLSGDHVTLAGSPTTSGSSGDDSTAGAAEVTTLSPATTTIAIAMIGTTTTAVERRIIPHQQSLNSTLLPPATLPKPLPAPPQTPSATTRQPHASSTSALPASPGVDDSSSVVRKFRLRVTRLGIQYIQALEVLSLANAVNISSELEFLLAVKQAALASADSAALPGEEGSAGGCALLPKGIRVSGSRFMLLAVGLNASGDPVPAKLMESTCGVKEWRPAAIALHDTLLNISHSISTSHLQILTLALAAAVVVLALLAVFLCAKWRLAVRGSRREASDGFYVKTFHTKEHQYKSDDDDPYGFPTIRRDSAFYRSDGSSGGGYVLGANGYANGGQRRPTAAHRIGGGGGTGLGRSSFLNGAFHDDSGAMRVSAATAGGGGGELPAAVSACLIDDAQFTDVPLHTLGSDSCGPPPPPMPARFPPPPHATAAALNGVTRRSLPRRSPPVPPVRTSSSGYHTTAAINAAAAAPVTASPSPPLITATSGGGGAVDRQAAAVAYHAPHEVLAMLPSIPREDYSDSESELEGDGQSEQIEQLMNRQKFVQDLEKHPAFENSGRAVVKTAL